MSYSLSAFATDDLQMQINELREQITELRAQQALTIFSFSGDLISRFDNVTSNLSTALTPATPSNPSYYIPGGTSGQALYGTNAAVAVAGAYSSYLQVPSYNDTVDAFRLKTDLNLNADVSKAVKFYSRLTATKYFNRFTSQGSNLNFAQDLHGPGSYTSDLIWLSRAYMDWAITPYWIFSLGRLPTTDGPPANYPDGRARGGTYPMISYNNYIDGLSLTYKLDYALPQDHSLSLRALYTPFNAYNAGSLLSSFENRNPYNGTNLNTPGAQSASTWDAGALQADYSVRNSWLANDTNLIVQYFQTGTFHLNQSAATSGAGNGDPTNVAFWVSELDFSFNFDGLFSSPFDLSLNYGYTNLGTQGTFFIPVSISSSAGSGYPTSAVYVPFGGYGCGPNSVTGLGCSQVLSGGNTIISGRYHINQKTLAGAEFEWGDPNVFYYAGAADDLSSFYGTNGNANHFYVTRLFSPLMSLRVGAMTQNYNYSGIFLGTSSTPITYTVSTYYANFRLDF